MKKSIVLLLLSISLLSANAQTKSEFERFRASFPMLPNGYTPNIEQIVSNEILNRDPWFSENHGASYKDITYYPVGVVCEGKEYIIFMYLVITKFGDDAVFSFDLIRSTYEGKKRFLNSDQTIARTDGQYHETFKLKRKKDEFIFTVSFTSKVNDYKGKKKITGTCD